MRAVTRPPRARSARAAVFVALSATFACQSNLDSDLENRDRSRGSAGGEGLEADDDAENADDESTATPGTSMPSMTTTMAPEPSMMPEPSGSGGTAPTATPPASTSGSLPTSSSGGDAGAGGAGGTPQGSGGAPTGGSSGSDVGGAANSGGAGSGGESGAPASGSGGSAGAAAAPEGGSAGASSTGSAGDGSGMGGEGGSAGAGAAGEPAIGGMGGAPGGAGGFGGEPALGGSGGDPGAAGSGGSASGAGGQSSGPQCFVMPGNGAISSFADWVDDTWGTSPGLTGESGLYGNTALTFAIDDAAGTLTLQGTLTSYAGFGLYFEPACVDASAFTGISITFGGVLGGATMAFQVQTYSNHPTNGSCEGNWGSDCANNQAAVSVPMTIGEVNVPFTSLVGGRPNDTTDTDQVLGLQWQFNCASSCAVDVVIEDVSFY